MRGGWRRQAWSREHAEFCFRPKRIGLNFDLAHYPHNGNMVESELSRSGMVRDSCLLDISWKNRNTFTMR